MSEYEIIEAPSNLGLRDTGVDQLAATLLQAGLADRLGATRGQRVASPKYSAHRDEKNGILNVDSLAGYTIALADAVGGVLERGAFPIVLGGDCSILLGNLLALRRRGRFGLLFVDGHADFYQPEANVNGEAASSELAFATGRGPKRLTAFERYERLIRDEDVVAFGFRDTDEQRQYGSQPLASDILALDLNSVRQLGIERAVDTAIARVSRPDLEGFWIHLDADVLDDAIMPAVEYHIPDGFSWEELEVTLRHARGSPHAVGMEVTIYNPGLDPGHRLAPRFVAALVAGLSPVSAAL
jgi:arginase